MSYKENKVSESYMERACGAASSIGTAVGRTVNWIGVSYRNIVKGSRNYDSAEREGRIISKLYKVKKRLHKIERNLRDSDALSIGKTSEDSDEDDLNSYRRNERERTLSLAQGLNHPNPKVRAAAAAKAAKSGTFTEIYFLILLLDDPVSNVRKKAWSAIKKITDSDFDFDPEEEETIRREKIEHLKNWWKEERMARR